MDKELLEMSKKKEKSNEQKVYTGNFRRNRDRKCSSPAVMKGMQAKARCRFAHKIGTNERFTIVNIGKAKGKLASPLLRVGIETGVVF